MHSIRGWLSTTAPPPRAVKSSGCLFCELTDDDCIVPRPTRGVSLLQAIDLIDEAGSRVRIAAYNARKGSAVKEDPKVDEYLQVMETKDAAVRDELYEEAQLLRRRQQDYKSELVGLPGVCVGRV